MQEADKGLPRAFSRGIAMLQEGPCHGNNCRDIRHAHWMADPLGEPRRNVS